MTKTVAHKLVERLTEQDGEHTSVLPQDVVSATADILESENYRVIHKNPELGGFSKADAKVGFENQHGEYFSIAFDLSEPGHMYLLDDSDSVMADASIDVRAGGHDWKYTIEGMLEQHEADIRKDGEMTQPEQLTENVSPQEFRDIIQRKNLLGTGDGADSHAIEALETSDSESDFKLKIVSQSGSFRIPNANKELVNREAKKQGLKVVKWEGNEVYLKRTGSESFTEIEDVDIDSDWNKLDRTTRANIFRTLDIPDHIMYDAISKSWNQLPEKLKQRLKAADEKGTLSLVAGEPEDTSNGEWDTFSKIESLHKNIQY